MILVGITGSIGHGKTTFAASLANNTTASGHWESSSIITEVANDLRSSSFESPAPDNITAINDWLKPLPAILQKRVHASIELDQLQLRAAEFEANSEQYVKLREYLEYMYATPSLQSLEITNDNKEHFRALQQWLGGYLVTISPSIWYDEITARIGNTPGLELATVGGLRYPNDATVLRLVGGTIISVQRPDIGQQDSTDLTEREQQTIEPDCIVYNNGSLEQLTACAKQVYSDLTGGSLSPEYYAVPAA
jgi:hypothetical protein